MTNEFLLDAIGLIDDDLIQEAEQVTPRVKVIPLRKSLSSLAACLTLVLILGYGVTHLPFAGSKSDSAASASTEASASPSASVSAGDGNPTASNATSESQTQDADVVFINGSSYSLTGEVLEKLPDGCRALDALPDTPEDYAYRSLWTQEDSDTPAILYLQLSDGRYAVAELVQS